ncbi:MAG TPA: methionyl-tRNA formyltransferase [Xanthomonadaceae bacterium]|nr:methionyl-tRNA formyltransferase [Xanthomonadaceae bacterium]
MSLVFAGTPEFAVPALEACLRGGQVRAVYTQPDRPAGRGRALAASPVKRRALAAGCPVRQPRTLREAHAQSELAALEPDLIVVVAYGLILPPDVLQIPRHGCWNVHASLLPRWRGAAPIQRAIEAGDAETGVCLMQMQAGLDTGPVLLSLRTPIHPDDTGGTMHDRLARLGAQVLEDGLKLLRAGLRPVAQPQPEAGVTYAHKLEKAEAGLDAAQPAPQLARKVRAFLPWPVAELELAGERVRVHAAEAVAGVAAAPGTVVSAGREGILVACGEGALRLTRLQRPGGRVLGAGEYLNGRPELRGA